jgi:hypothetical protein
VRRRPEAAQDPGSQSILAMTSKHKHETARSEAHTFSAVHDKSGKCSKSSASSLALSSDTRGTVSGLVPVLRPCRWRAPVHHILVCSHTPRPKMLAGRTAASATATKTPAPVRRGTPSAALGHACARLSACGPIALSLPSRGTRQTRSGLGARQRSSAQCPRTGRARRPRPSCRCAYRGWP